MSWDYTGAVDLCCLDGNHVTAAGGHGTEQVRLAGRRGQVSSRKQKGTERARLCCQSRELWMERFALRLPKEEAVRTLSQLISTRALVHFIVWNHLLVLHSWNLKEASKLAFWV